MKNICERTFEFATRIVKLCQELDKTQGVSRTLATNFFVLELQSAQM